MKHSFIKTQKGIGLIEVLITTVVVATGLLAVASLQGGFMSSSGESKTRSEALVLAEQKLEELRNTVTLGNAIDPLGNPVLQTGYDTLLVAGIYVDPPIQGKNADFTRSWTINDVDPPIPPFKATDPQRKRVSVQVGWDGNGDGDATDADEIVNVVTEMAWNDPAKALRYAEEFLPGFSTVASPRQNASEDAAAENVIGTNLAIIDLEPISTPNNSAGVDESLQVTTPSNQVVTLTQVATGSHYYTATHGALSTIEEGVIAVFLCTDPDNNILTQNETCTHIQNHFGGVVHRIAGTVHSTSHNDLTDIFVAWTSSEVTACYNGPVTVVSGSGTDQYRHRPYECVYAGNCDATADNVNGCTYDVTDAQILDRNVGPGGEYGDVGLLGLDDRGANREQVCFLEDTGDPGTSVLLTAGGSKVMNEDYLYAVTKRFYSARRIKRNASINDQKSEGINRSYTHHDFLVVPRGTGGTANQTCHDKAVLPYTAAAGVQLAPREIFKTLDEGVLNTSLAEAAYTGAAGTAKTLTGSVTGSATRLKLIIPDQGSCYLNNNAHPYDPATAYACVVPSDTADVIIKGGSDEYSTHVPALWAWCTKTDAPGCNWPGNFIETAAPDDCTPPWGGQSIHNGDSVLAYQDAEEGWNGIGTKPATCQNAETRTCGNIPTPGTLSGTYTHQTCEIVGPDCTTPWGTTVSNGGNTTAYELQFVLPPELGGVACDTLVHTRTCNNGILSGIGNFGSCDVQTTHDIQVTVAKTGTGSVSNIIVIGSGATCVDAPASSSVKVCTVDIGWTGTLTATATCSGSLAGPVSGSVDVTDANVTAATITLDNCDGPVCPLPWNASSSIASDESVLAVSSATVTHPGTCSSETRFCYDGVLSGSYAIQPPCSVICTVPNLIGMPTNSAADRAAVSNAITSAGFTVGAATDIGTGPKQVSVQIPTSGLTPACDSAITYTYN